jgi:hypothetical protein
MKMFYHYLLTTVYDSAEKQIAISLVIEQRKNEFGRIAKVLNSQFRNIYAKKGAEGDDNASPQNLIISLSQSYAN